MASTALHPLAIAGVLLIHLVFTCIISRDFSRKRQHKEQKLEFYMHGWDGMGRDLLV